MEQGVEQEVAVEGVWPVICRLLGSLASGVDVFSGDNHTVLPVEEWQEGERGGGAALLTAQRPTLDDFLSASAGQASSYCCKYRDLT